MDEADTARVACALLRYNLRRHLSGLPAVVIPRDTAEAFALRELATEKDAPLVHRTLLVEAYRSECFRREKREEHGGAGAMVQAVRAHPAFAELTSDYERYYATAKQRLDEALRERLEPGGDARRDEGGDSPKRPRHA